MTNHFCYKYIEYKNGIQKERHLLYNSTREYKVSPMQRNINIQSI